MSTPQIPKPKVTINLVPLLRIIIKLIRARRARRQASLINRINSSK